MLNAVKIELKKVAKTQFHWNYQSFIKRWMLQEIAQELRWTELLIRPLPPYTGNERRLRQTASFKSYWIFDCINTFSNTSTILIFCLAEHSMYPHLHRLTICSTFSRFTLRSSHSSSILLPTITIGTSGPRA